MHRKPVPGNNEMLKSTISDYFNTASDFAIQTAEAIAELQKQLQKVYKQ